MVAIISRNSLGLGQSSLGLQGQPGNPQAGQGGENAYLDVANGNLVTMFLTWLCTLQYLSKINFSSIEGVYFVLVGTVIWIAVVYGVSYPLVRVIENSKSHVPVEAWLKTAGFQPEVPISDLRFSGSREVAFRAVAQDGRRAMVKLMVRDRYAGSYFKVAKVIELVWDD